MRAVVTASVWMSVVLAPLARAQKRPASRAPATIEGDVYVVTKSGDTKRGAGRTVLLLRDDGLRDRIRSECASSLEQEVSLFHWVTALVDSESLSRAGQFTKPDILDLLGRETRITKGIADIRRDARDSVLSDIAHSFVDSVGTGINAHYRFSVTKPGPYVLFAEWAIGDNDYIWWAPLVVGATGTTTKDLDNSTLIEPAAVCLGPAKP